MNLSKNFTLEELTTTTRAANNTPNQASIEALKMLCEKVLQPLRDLYGKPIRINSGYRSLMVNRLAGGATGSQHTKGEAADIDTANDNALLFKLIRDNFTFDQLIWEKGDDKNPAWVHVSYRKHGNRKMVLRYKNGKYIHL